MSKELVFDVIWHSEGNVEIVPHICEEWCSEYRCMGLTEDQVGDMVAYIPEEDDEDVQ